MAAPELVPMSLGPVATDPHIQNAHPHLQLLRDSLFLAAYIGGDRPQVVLSRISRAVMRAWKSQGHQGTVILDELHPPAESFFFN